MRTASSIIKFIAGAFVTMCVTALPCRAESLPGHLLVEKSVKTKLLRESSAIDAVYSDGVFSHIEYNNKAELSSYPESSLPAQVIEKPQATPFGACRVVNGRFLRSGTGYCGVVLRLSASTPLNLAAVDSLEIQGSFSGTWRLAIADLPRHLLDDNLPIDVVIEQKGTSLELATLVKKVDLTRVMSLVLILDSQEGSASVERICFSHSPSPAASQPHGVWLWNNRLVPGHEADVIKRLLSNGIGRVYLQINDDPGRFLPFVEAAHKKGIDVFALDGDPGYVEKPEALLGRIAKVAKLKHSASGAAFAGFQVDIEPYLNKDFALRREYYVSAYLELLSRLKKQGGMPLSVVVPFWFDSIHFRGTTLLQKVVEIADELVVMSYRTNSAELLDVSMAELGLGEKFGKPVRLGIELGRIPNERHIELEPASDGGDIHLAGMWWKKKRDYTVSGDRISFKNSTKALPAYMATPIPFRSFGGWVLHSYEELGSPGQ